MTSFIKTYWSWLFLGLILFYNKCEAKTIRVAVIDTGITNSRDLPLCKTGHKSFVDSTLKDTNGHGTNVAHLINRHANGADYCLIILKFYPTNNAVKSTIAALRHVLKLNVDIVNYSAGGTGSSRTEQEILKKIINRGTTVVAAAGNESTDLSRKCDYFPACYFKDHIIVGNGTSPTNRAASSNYGSPVDLWFNGEDQSAGGHTLSGTSQSAAIATGRIVDWASAKRKPNSAESRAVNKAAQAAYKQTGLNKKVNNELNKIKKKLPKSVKAAGEVIIPITEGIINQRIQYEWEF